jgi:hypothetical protein
MPTKLLVAYGEEKRCPAPGDFLCVVLESGRPVFWGLRSKRVWNAGCMVYVGKNVSDRDLFAKLVESGRKIDDVGRELERLAAYLRQVEGLKIGNVASVEAELGEPGFRLVKLAETPRFSDPKKLP